MAAQCQRRYDGTFRIYRVVWILFGHYNHCPAGHMQYDRSSHYPVFNCSGYYFWYNSRDYHFLLGEFIGCILSFVFTRFFFRAHAEKLIEKNNMLTRLDSYSNMKSMLIARSIPYSPNILITALGAVSSLSFKAHFWATFIGKWPSVIIEVFLGHDLLNLAEHGLRFIFLVVLCIAGYFYMRWRKNSKNRK